MKSISYAKIIPQHKKYENKQRENNNKERKKAGKLTLITSEILFTIDSIYSLTRNVCYS